MLVSPEPVSDGLLLSAHTSSHLPPRHLPGGLPLPLHGRREVKSQPPSFTILLYSNEPLPMSRKIFDFVSFVQTIKWDQIAETIWHSDWRRGRTSDSSRGTNGLRGELRRPPPTSSSGPTATGPTRTPGVRRSPWSRWSWPTLPGTGTSRSMSTVTMANPSDLTSPISVQRRGCPLQPISAIRSQTCSWAVIPV